MMAAAQMFGVDCAFANSLPNGARDGSDPTEAEPREWPRITIEAAAAAYGQVIACENLPEAHALYGFRPAASFALLVGNERRGLTYSSRKMATHSVQIPMLSRRINCLNVSAAAAIALNYLIRIRVGPIARTVDPASRRPDVLLSALNDHVELGSAIRSAAAFGWSRILLEDRFRVWFGVDRVRRSEGRAAARRARNDIRVIPIADPRTITVPEVIVVTADSGAAPLHRLDLARGVRQLIVVPDEGKGEIDASALERQHLHLRIASLGLSPRRFPYHYRLIASLTLAEVARQVGARAPRIRRVKVRPEYLLRLPLEVESAGESISLEELLSY